MKSVSLSAGPLAFAALAMNALPNPLAGQTGLSYQEPPPAIVDLIDARPPPPAGYPPADSSGRRWMMIGYPHGLPAISDLAQPELRLAGLRFNPNTNGP